MIASIKRLPVMRIFAGDHPPRAAVLHRVLHAGLARVMPDYLMARGRWLRVVGWPGMLGAGLLAACPAFYMSAIHPARVRMQDAHAGAVSVQQRMRLAQNGLGRADLPPAEQLAQFYRIFPKERALLPWLKKVFALAAAQGINLDQGEYTLVRDRVGKLARFEMTFPVKSQYPRIRQYLNNLRANIPFLALEHLHFERRKVSDPQVEAKLRLTIYVEDDQ